MSNDQQKMNPSLQMAAQLITTPALSVHDAEVLLAEAIERGELHADIKRWATEQWEGSQLPGNLNRRETFIELDALQAWLDRHQKAT